MSRDITIKKYFTNIQLEEENITVYTVRKLIFEAIQRATPHFFGEILDIGCGIMPYREYILENNQKVIKYIGCDFEASLNEEYAMGKPELFWDGKTLPVADNSIDTVLMTELLEHCPYPEEVLKEAYRVLKPNGKIFFTVPFVWTLHVIPYDEYRYTPFSLKRHIENAGFKNVAIESLGNIDASLAQMLNIWLGCRPIKNKWAKWFFNLVFYPFIKKLLKWDKEWSRTRFEQDVMPTGFAGFANK